MKNLKEKSGITLIALVITIIVLLILAGVTISTLTGDNGLLQKAQNAKEKSSDAEIEEQIKLAYQEYQLGKFMDSNLRLEDSMKASLEKMINDAVLVEEQGNSIKITFTNSSRKFKYYSNGKVKELMDPTPVYGRLDEENEILYLGKTDKNGYKRMTDRRINNNNWPIEHIKKVIIEEEIAPSDISQMFSGCTNLLSIEGIEKIHLENVTSLSQMFFNCTKLTSLDLSGFDTNNIISITGMFCNCDNLINLNLNGFDTENVTNMSQVFRACRKLQTLNLGNSFVINEDINKDDMFKEVTIGTNPKIITTKVTKAKLKSMYSDFTDANFETID